MADLVDQARMVPDSDEEVARICERRVLEARKALSRASVQVANISYMSVDKRPEPQLSRLGSSLFERKKKLKKCTCGALMELTATLCGDCTKRQAEVAAASALESKALAQWTMVKDSAGRTYYWNQVDDTTSWVAPLGFVPPAIAPSTPTPSPASKNQSGGGSNINSNSNWSLESREDNVDKDDGDVEEQEDFISEATDYGEKEQIEEAEVQELMNSNNENENILLDKLSSLSLHDRNETVNENGGMDFDSNFNTPRSTTTIEAKNGLFSTARKTSLPSSSVTTEYVSPFSPTGRRRHSKLAEEFAVLTEDTLNSGTPKTGSWKSTYNMIGLMGLGAFGSVHLVENKNTKAILALKAVNLFHLNEKQKRLSESQLANEKVAFTRITDHRFLLSCHEIHEEDNVTFLLLDACLGGDLSFMMNKGRHFTERMVQFYGACLVLALDHLHSKKLVHCDVKPENILLDSKGYPKLCDYGNSKDLTNGNVTTDLGTIEYCAPEIVERKPHGTAVDVWALGVFLYELATGSCPFAGADRAGTVRRIVSEPIKLSGCSADLTSLLQGMLNRDASARTDLSAIKTHRWFSGIDWEALQNFKAPAPIVPVIANNKDLSNFVGMDHVECSVCRGFGVRM